VKILVSDRALDISINRNHARYLAKPCLTDAFIAVHRATINLQADSIRDEKVKVLKSMRRIAPAEVATTAVRAQYTAGFIEGKPVKGYLEEDGVKPHSVTETYAACA
jgi:glucose-6-phosphate 1-dehydrogenase